MQYNSGLVNMIKKTYKFACYKDLNGLMFFKAKTGRADRSNRMLCLVLLQIIYMGQLFCLQPEPRLAVKKNPLAIQNNANQIIAPQKEFVLAPVVYVEQNNIKEQLERDFARELPSPKEAKERYKKYKKTMTTSMPTWGSFFSSKTITDMDYQQLLQRKNELILAGDYHMAATYLEHMLKKAQTPEQIMYIMLEWGEVLMHLDQMAKAETIFRDFIAMYPGNEYAQIAFVKAIECSWYQTQMFERDQTKTEETLQLIHTFYARKEHYNPLHVQKVMDIQLQCEQKLVQSKLSIIQQYITRSRYAAAHTCIKALREADYANIATIEPELLHVEITLARAEGDTTTEAMKLQELSTKFPVHELTIALTAPKKSWFARA